jgi:hypothetical protein
MTLFSTPSAAPPAQFITVDADVLELGSLNPNLRRAH